MQSATRSFTSQIKKTADLVRIDRSKPFLRLWYRQGFRAVRIKLADVSCNVCRSMRNAEFYIFNLLNKDNPIFRITHPNCRCGMIPIPESNVDHEHFNEKTGYKVKIKDIKKTPAPTETPPVRRPGDEEEADEVDPAFERKIEQIKKDIERTEKKINEVENPIFEVDEEALDDRAKEKNINIKRYLHRYLDLLKDFMAEIEEKKEKAEEKLETAEESRKNSPLESD